MKPVSPRKKFLVLGGIFIVFPLFVYMLSTWEHRHTEVPYFHPREVVSEVNGESIIDTVYHTIPEFSFIDQDSLPYTSDSLKGKIYVADFFFTTCPSICPIMTAQMNQLYWKLDKSAYQGIHYISYTVNPEYDTPEILKAYAKKNEINTKRWRFVTGEKREIYELGVNGYYLNAQEDALAPGGFLHSNLFVLVDKEGHVRGYYDGTSSEEVRDLAGDIAMLIASYKRKAKESERG